MSLITLSCADDNSNVTGSNDDTPPAAITDLSTGNPTGSSVTLDWTAPGDDNNLGKAKVYDIRYATFMITGNNFASATQVSNVPSPKVVGESESFLVAGLASNTIYYFAIRTADEVPNWSGLSNIDSTTTLLSGSWLVYNTANSGLPSDIIYDIAISGANKYFGTAAGMALFDGTDWSVYDTSISNIVGNHVNTVTATVSGQDIWIGTQNNGANLFDGSSFVNYTESTTGLSINSVRSIATMEVDNIWIGTGNAGLFQLQNSIWTNYNFSSGDLSSNSISTLSFDSTGNLWIGYSFGGASKFDGNNFIHYSTSDGLASNAVWAIFSDNNNIWFGTNNGVSVFNGVNWITYNTVNSSLVDDVVISVAVDLSGNKWFGTRFGLSRFDGSNWITYTTENSGLPDNFINAIEIDMVGNLWLGTNNGAAIYTE
ncbi:MAG: two-component regulator propeller domain-containing protein [Candidatus Zixiibacteriota bacterium]